MKRRVLWLLMCELICFLSFMQPFSTIWAEQQLKINPDILNDLSTKEVNKYKIESSYFDDLTNKMNELFGKDQSAFTKNEHADSQYVGYNYSGEFEGFLSRFGNVISLSKSSPIGILYWNLLSVNQQLDGAKSSLTELSFASSEQVKQQVLDYLALLKLDLETQVTVTSYTATQMQALYDKVLEQPDAAYQHKNQTEFVAKDIYLVQVTLLKDQIPFNSVQFGDLENGIATNKTSVVFIVSQDGLESIDILGFNRLAANATKIKADKQQALSYIQHKYDNILLVNQTELVNLSLVYVNYTTTTKSEESEYFKPTWLAEVKQTYQQNGEEHIETIYLFIDAETNSEVQF